MLRRALLCLLVGGCSFDTDGPDPGNPTDASPDAVDADAGGDAALDATPDAPLPTCSLSGTPLALGVMQGGSTLGGANELVSADMDCGGASSPEHIYFVTLPERADLRVTTDLAGTQYDTVVYVRSDCADGATEKVCNSGTNPGLGEETWAMDLPPGTYSVVVDGYTGGAGSYGVLASARPIVTAGNSCDMTGVTDRCEPGSTCTTGLCIPDDVVCAAAADEIPLSRTPTMGNTAGGDTDYEPMCSDDTGGRERVHKVNVNVSGAGKDLVVEILAQGPPYNPVLDVTTTCGDPPTSLACVDAYGGNASEAVSIPGPSMGMHYLAVDGTGGTAGPYAIRAWLRPQRAVGAACDPRVLDDRCVASACVQAAAGPVCTAVPVAPDGEDNYDFCAGSGGAGEPEGPFAADFQFAGRMNSATDSDVLELTPAVDTRIVASAVGTDGGCPVALRLALYGGGCTLLDPNPNLLASATGGSVGTCPYLDTETAGVVLEAGETYWIELPAPIPFRAANYVLSVDFVTVD